MLSELYDALKDAGSKEELARKAAKAVAPREPFERIDHRVEGTEKRIRHLESDMAVVKWMLGFNLAVSLTCLYKLLGM